MLYEQPVQQSSRGEAGTEHTILQASVGPASEESEREGREKEERGK